MKLLTLTTLAGLAVASANATTEASRKLQATVGPAPVNVTTSRPNAGTNSSSGSSGGGLAPGSNAGGKSFPWDLKKLKTSDSYHMKPVRAIHARVQGDMPEWDETLKAFVSSFGKDSESKFRAVFDTVNTASVEGALTYVQAEGINYNTRSTEQKCIRKNKMKYVVFYDIAMAQTNETLALYEGEYGQMIPMDGGQCTPEGKKFPESCLYYNGDDGEPNVGPFVGGGTKDTDPRAPYPNTWWYSFPNTCPLQVWANKTDTCRKSTRTGLCPFDTMPDGKTCTFNYRILGFVAIDDVVGITAMQDKSGKNYTNFTTFCEDGGVEFKGSEAGVWEESIPFWEKPQDKDQNAKRAKLLVEAYNRLVPGGNATGGNASSGQVPEKAQQHFLALPAVEKLAAENPPCYENVKKCATATYGCKRELYGQICTECTAQSPECKVAPKDFKFPTLTKAMGTKGTTGNGTMTTPSGSKGAGSGGKDGSKAPSKGKSGATNAAQASATIILAVAGAAVAAFM